MNKAILMGRLVRDPNVTYGQGERPLAVAKYTIAIDQRLKRDGDATADFINCVAFGKSAEFAEKYFRQGIKIVVEGRIQTGSYTDREGVKRYTTDIIIESQEFAESKSSNDGSNHSNNQASSTPAPSAAMGDDFMNIPDEIDVDNLPFN